jgi:site-specific DNA-methyltransferase (adenine-specific)
MKLYSYEGDIILDPFNGSGQTTKIALHLQRRFIGVDIINEYVKLARSRLSEPIHIRAEALIANWKKIPSHHS